MADSQYIFDYLNDVWDLLPDQDKVRFGETWKAYEQTYGSVWMQQFDSDLANTITRLPLYNILRWIQHTFDASTQVFRSVTYVSPQDLSGHLDLSARYLIRLAIDGGAQFEIDCRGHNPSATTLAEIVARINVVVGQNIASAVNANQLLQFTTVTQGPSSSLDFYATSAPAHDASEFILGFTLPELPAHYPKYPYQYQLSDQRVVGIPTLQNKIHDDQVTSLLEQNTDYTVEFGTGVISFIVTPPTKMWAKDTLINYETPYNNFGYLMDLYDSNTPNYLKAVQGLWFAFWQGPRPEYIKRSLYLLFGLPTASKPGTVTSVTPTTISLTYNDTTIENFTVPAGLEILVTVGETLTQYQPLVSGIRVFDKVNYPGFLRLEIGRPAVKPFLTQNATVGLDPSTDESRAILLLEANTYLPQIDVNAFISPDINVSNITSFLRNIQPRSRTYLLQILIGVFKDQLPIMDEGLTTQPDFTLKPDGNPRWPNGRPALGLDISFDTTPNVDWNNNTMGNNATWLAAESDPYTGLILDDDVLIFGDHGHVDVYQSAVLIDSFSIEG